MIDKKIVKSGRSVPGTSRYVLGQDAEHLDDNEKVEATGYSCPGRQDVQDVQDACAWLERDAEEYHLQDGRGPATAHWVISFEAGEHPTPEQVAQMIPIWRERMGMPPEAPLIYGVHVDTAHVHVHIHASRLVRDRQGRLAIGSLNTEDNFGQDSDRGRVRFHDFKASARACAEICQVQGWNPKNLAWDVDGRRIHKAEPADGVKLAPGVADAEAHSGQQHPSHTLGLGSINALRQATTWDEANKNLASFGAKLDRVQLKNGGEGGAIVLDDKTRIKLSQLPRDCSLKNLDVRYGGQAITPPPEPAKDGAARVRNVAESRRPKIWTAAKVAAQCRRHLADSTGWSDFLPRVQKEGFFVVRAGKAGAVISAQDGAGGEIRVKMSDVGKGTSYAKISAKFGATIEQAVESGQLDAELVASVVKYYQPEAQPGQAAQDQPQAPPVPVDPDAVRLPAEVVENEALTGVTAPERVLAETARDVIRESLQKDSGIQQTVERLAAKGIAVKPVITPDGQLAGLRLTSPGLRSSIALSALPKDCRLPAMAAKFGQVYRKGQRPQQLRPGAGAVDVVQIDPDDDLLTILSKGFAQLIANSEAMSTDTAQRRWDRTELTSVTPQTPDRAAALDIRVPKDLSPEQAEAWKRNELVRGAFREAAAGAKEGGDFWAIAHESLARAGLRLEGMPPAGQVVVADAEGKASTLRSHNISYSKAQETFGQAPRLPIHGWEQMNADERRVVTETIQIRQALAPGDWNEVVKRLDKLGARIEKVGHVGGRIVAADGRQIKLSELGHGFDALRRRKEGDLDAILRARQARPEDAHAPAAKRDVLKSRPQLEKERAERDDQAKKDKARQDEKAKEARRQAAREAARAARFNREERSFQESLEKLMQRTELLNAEPEDTKSEELQEALEHSAIEAQAAREEQERLIHEQIKEQEHDTGQHE